MKDRVKFLRQVRALIALRPRVTVALEEDFEGRPRAEAKAETICRHYNATCRAVLRNMNVGGYQCYFNEKRQQIEVWHDDYTLWFDFQGNYIGRDED